MKRARIVGRVEVVHILLEGHVGDDDNDDCGGCGGKEKKKQKKRFVDILRSAYKFASPLRSGIGKKPDYALSGQLRRPTLFGSNKAQQASHVMSWGFCL